MHCCGTGCWIVSVGSATRLSVVPLWPVWPPGGLPDGSRNELVFLVSPSDDGGLLEFWLVLFTFDSSASRRANKLKMSVSFSSCERRERSGAGGFFAMPA